MPQIKTQTSRRTYFGNLVALPVQHVGPPLLLELQKRVPVARPPGRLVPIRVANVDLVHAALCQVRLHYVGQRPELLLRVGEALVVDYHIYQKIYALTAQVSLAEIHQQHAQRFVSQHLKDAPRLRPPLHVRVARVYFRLRQPAAVLAPPRKDPAGGMDAPKGSAICSHAVECLKRPVKAAGVLGSLNGGQRAREPRLGTL